MNREILVVGGTQFVLVPAVVMLCAWFGLHSRVFAAATQAEIDLNAVPGAISVEQFSAGDSLDSLTLLGVSMRDRTGKSVLKAKRVYAKADLKTLRMKSRDVLLHLKNVTVDDFELALEWNRLGHLSLADVFQKRSIRLKTQKKPPALFDLDLHSIHLTNGLLHLRWPTFGFTFDGIHTSGKMALKNGDLSIGVPELAASGGSLWLTSAPKWLKERLSKALTPQGQLENLPIVVPLNQVSIKQFDWTDDAFSTSIRVGLKNGGSIETEGLMGFPGSGIKHALSLSLELNDSWVRAFTNNHVRALSRISITTKGTDLSGSFQLNKAQLGQIRIGSTHAEMVTVDSVKVALAPNRARIAASVQAGAIKHSRFGLTDASITTSLSTEWQGLTPNKLVSQLARSPYSTGSKALMGSTNLLIDRIQAKRLTIANYQAHDIAVDQLAVKNEQANIEASLKQATAAKHGSISAKAKASISLGFTGVQSNAVIVLTLTGVPTSLLRLALGEHPALKASDRETFSGSIELQGPLAKPSKIAVTKVTEEAAQ